MPLPACLAGTAGQATGGDSCNIRGVAGPSHGCVQDGDAQSVMRDAECLHTAAYAQARHLAEAAELAKRHANANEGPITAAVTAVKVAVEPSGELPPKISTGERKKQEMLARLRAGGTMALPAATPARPSMDVAGTRPPTVSKPMPVASATEPPQCNAVVPPPTNAPEARDVAKAVSAAPSSDFGTGGMTESERKKQAFIARQRARQQAK